MPIQSFLKYLKFEKRYSTHTISAYQSDLDQAFTYFKETFEIEFAGEITHQLIRSWIVSLITQGQSARSVNRKMSSLRAYYKFLQRDGTLQINPTIKVQSLKLPKRLPQYLHESQMNRMLNEGDVESPDFLRLRDQLLITTLYYTGIRRSELIELQESDVDILGMQMRVLGKGQKVRLIPLVPNYLKEFQPYLEKKQALFPGESYLFLSKKGTKLYPKLVYNIVSKHLTAFSTLSQKGPHTLRHTFATHLSNHGADLNAIKDLLGHASLSATQVYTHNSIDKLKKAYTKAHPKAKL